MHFDKATSLGGYNVIGAHTNIAGAKIGRHTYIANHVVVQVYTHPSSTFVSTSPVFYSTARQMNSSFVAENAFEEELSVNGHSVVIGNDVWKGSSVTLKGGIPLVMALSWRWEP